MKNYIFIIGIIALATSCASIHHHELRVAKKNDPLLLALEPRIDLNSFETAFSMGSSKGTSTSYASSLTGTSAIGLSSYNATMHKDPRVQDAITLFDRDVKDNLTDPYGEKKGYVLCKIAFGSSDDSGYGWAALSGLTLLIPNFFGMPFWSHTTTLDVEVEIYDLKEKLLGKYNSHCTNQAWVAMYYGYTSKDAARKSGMEAFKCALSGVKEKISKDTKRINGELLKNSSVSSN